MKDNTTGKFMKLVLFVMPMLSGCFSIQLGTYETELPSSVSHLPNETVSVRSFDGFVMTAKGGPAYGELHLAAKGRFVVKKNPKRVFDVPKKCSVGFCPGYAVPAPSMLSRTPYKPLMMYCMFWTIIDALFIEPFSGYEPNLNTSNLAQFAFLGCCKYNDIENAKIVREIPCGDSEVEVNEYPFDDCIISLEMGIAFGMTNAIKAPVKNGIAIFPTIGTNAAGGRKGIVLPVRFDTLPPVGGELGEVLRERLMGQTFRIVIEE